MPFITRLYGASDYGIWVIILTVSGFFVPLATFRYELAMVLAPTRRISAALALAIMWMVLTTSFFIAVIFYIIPSDMGKIISGLPPEHQNMFFLIPLVIIILAFQSVLQAWLTREHRFLILSLAQFCQASVTTTFVLFLPFLFGATVLVVAISAISGILSAIMVMAWNAKDLFHSMKQKKSRTTILYSLRRYKVYALYVVPYSLSAGITERIVQISLASTYSLGTLGSFFVGRQIVTAPATLVGNAWRQVLFAYGAQTDTNSETKQRINRILQLLIPILAPILGFGIVWLKPLFIIIFGTRWQQLPEFSWWLMFMGSSLLFVGGFERIFDVLGRQKLSVILRIGIDLLLILTLLVSLHFGFEAITTVAIFSITSTVTNFICLGVILRLLQFNWHDIARLFFGMIMSVMIWSSIHFGISQLKLGNLEWIVAFIILIFSLFPVLFQFKKRP